MAKDPAFLFYPNDFLSGTQFFTDEQVGKYIRILMAQHQHGHLPENHVIFICKSYDKDIFSKLKKDSGGLWYNERLEIEIEKRKNYISSRSKNKEGKTKEKIISKSYDLHMENRDVNDNVLKNNKEPKIEIEPPDFTKPDINGDVVVFSFDTAPMRELWANWKRYRWTEHQLKYGMMGEQAELKNLVGLTFQETEKTILKAISSKWKTLYPEKGNGKSTGTFKKPGITAEGTRDRLNSYTD